MKSTPLEKHAHIHDLFNIFASYSSGLNNFERTTIARILNSLILGLNSTPYMPRYLLFVIDRYIIDSSDFFGYGNGQVLEGNIHWLVKEVKKCLTMRGENLKNVRPGALSSAMEPRIVWVEMIVWPNLINKN